MGAVFGAGLLQQLSKIYVPLIAIYFLQRRLCIAIYTLFVPIL